MFYWHYSVFTDFLHLNVVCYHNVLAVWNRNFVLPGLTNKYPCNEFCNYCHDYYFDKIMIEKYTCNCLQKGDKSREMSVYTLTCFKCLLSCQQWEAKTVLYLLSLHLKQFLLQETIDIRDRGSSNIKTDVSRYNTHSPFCLCTCVFKIGFQNFKWQNLEHKLVNHENNAFTRWTIIASMIQNLPTKLRVLANLKEQIYPVFNSDRQK